MDQAQSAAGTGEAEQPTQTQSEPKVEGNQNRSNLSSIGDELRAQLGKELDIENEKPPKKEPKKQPEEEPEEEEPEEPEQPEPEEEEEQPAEELPAAADADGEEEGESEVHEDWPKAAKARVAEEARKRRERTKERDQWKTTAETLHAQLQQVTSRQLQPTKALSEVVDRQSLTAAEKHWKEIRRFARTNPDGAEDVLIGKDADGNEIRKDYSRDAIIQMGLDADEALEALPAKREWVAKAEKETEAAKRVYPELFRDTQAGREAAGIVEQNPWILQKEDWAFAVGDYLAGRKARLAKQGKNGGKMLSAGAQAILGAPKVAPAPGVIKSRSASGGPGGGPNGRERGNVDIKQAKEEFAAREYAPEAMDDFITNLRIAQGAKSGAVKKALA